MSNLTFSGDKNWDTVTLEMSLNGVKTDVIFRVSLRVTSTQRKWQVLEHGNAAYYDKETKQQVPEKPDEWHDIDSPEHIQVLEQKYAELGCRMAKQYREFINKKNAN